MALHATFCVLNLESFIKDQTYSKLSVWDLRQDSDTNVSEKADFPQFTSDLEKEWQLKTLYKILKENRALRRGNTRL